MTTAAGGAQGGSGSGPAASVQGTQEPATQGEPITEPQTSGQPAGQADEQERRLTRENQSLRARVKAYEEAAAQQEAATLNEAQKLAKDNTKLAEQVEQFKKLYAETLVRYEAQALGFRNADLGASLVMNGLEFGDDGKPTNAKELLSALLKTDGYLKADASGEGKQEPPTSAPLGATNGGGGKPGQTTLEDLRKGKLSVADAKALWDSGDMLKIIAANNTSR